MHYTGVILITPDSKEPQRDIEIMVEADVISFKSNGSTRRRGKTIGADLDDDEDDDVMMGTTAAASAMAPQRSAAAHANNIGTPSTTKMHDHEYKIKYGHSTANGWDPIQVSQRQQLWLQRSLTLTAAFMLASFIYILFYQLLHLQPIHPLVPPNPWFVAVLIGIAPAATLGALLVNWNISNGMQEMIDRACTGMASAFLALALFRIPWQLIFGTNLALLQLVVLLLVTSIGATVGTIKSMSDYINFAVSWFMSRLYRTAIATIVVLGGIIGFLLTLGLASVWGIIVAIVIGLGIGAALVWRVDYLMRQNARSA